VKTIIDTNVFISGIFWTGPPYEILKAWSQDKLKFCLSLEILEEYKKVANILQKKFPAIELEPYFDLLTIKAEMYNTIHLPNQVSLDPDDDKFIACALTSRSNHIISGDKHLLDISGYQDITVLKPRAFVDQYLNQL